METKYQISNDLCATNWMVDRCGLPKDHKGNCRMALSADIQALEWRLEWLSRRDRKVFWRWMSRTGSKVEAPMVMDISHIIETQKNHEKNNKSQAEERRKVVSKQVFCGHPAGSSAKFCSRNPGHPGTSPHRFLGARQYHMIIDELAGLTDVDIAIYAEWIKRNYINPNAWVTHTQAKVDIRSAIGSEIVDRKKRETRSAITDTMCKAYDHRTVEYCVKKLGHKNKHITARMSEREALVDILVNESTANRELLFGFLARVQQPQGFSGDTPKARATSLYHYGVQSQINYLQEERKKAPIIKTYDITEHVCGSRGDICMCIEVQGHTGAHMTAHPIRVNKWEKLLGGYNSTDRTLFWAYISRTEGIDWDTGVDPKPVEVDTRVNRQLAHSEGQKPGDIDKIFCDHESLDGSLQCAIVGGHDSEWHSTVLKIDLSVWKNKLSHLTRAELKAVRKWARRSAFKFRTNVSRDWIDDRIEEAIDHKAAYDKIANMMCGVEWDNTHGRVKCITMGTEHGIAHKGVSKSTRKHLINVLADHDEVDLALAIKSGSGIRGFLGMKWDSDEAQIADIVEQAIRDQVKRNFDKIEEARARQWKREVYDIFDDICGRRPFMGPCVLPKGVGLHVHKYTDPSTITNYQEALQDRTHEERKLFWKYMTRNKTPLYPVSDARSTVNWAVSTQRRLDIQVHTRILPPNDVRREMGFGSETTESYSILDDMCGHLSHGFICTRPKNHPSSVVHTRFDMPLVDRYREVLQTKTPEERNLFWAHQARSNQYLFPGWSTRNTVRAAINAQKNYLDPANPTTEYYSILDDMCGHLSHGFICTRPVDHTGKDHGFSRLNLAIRYREVLQTKTPEDRKLFWGYQNRDGRFLPEVVDIGRLVAEKIESQKNFVHNPWVQFHPGVFGKKY